jgi:hypothetical protein
MSKKSRIIILIVIIMVATSFVAYNYVMHGAARNLENEETKFIVSSSSISSEFTTNIESANKKYLEKAVAIKGKITTCNGNEIILDENIICNFKDPDKSIQNGETITVKGRIVGYDDLMGELKLDQCFVIKN